MFEELENETKDEIGKRLREVREQKKETLTTMAIKYSQARGIIPPISHSQIQAYETGHFNSRKNKRIYPTAPYHYVLWIYETYHVDLIWLLTGK